MLLLLLRRRRRLVALLAASMRTGRSRRRLQPYGRQEPPYGRQSPLAKCRPMPGMVATHRQRAVWRAYSALTAVKTKRKRAQYILFPQRLPLPWFKEIGILISCRWSCGRRRRWTNPPPPAIGALPFPLTIPDCFPVLLSCALLCARIPWDCATDSPRRQYFGLARGRSAGGSDFGEGSVLAAA